MVSLQIGGGKGRIRYSLFLVPFFRSRHSLGWPLLVQITPEVGNTSCRSGEPLVGSTARTQPAAWSSYETVINLPSAEVARRLPSCTAHKTKREQNIRSF